MLKFRTWFEAMSSKRPNLRDIKDISTDEMQAAIDSVKEAGTDDDLEPNNLARFMRSNWPTDSILAKHLHSIHLKKQGGSSWYNFNLFNKRALESFCQFLNISAAKHIQPYRLRSEDYTALISPERIIAIAQQVLAEHPEMFTGSLKYYSTKSKDAPGQRTLFDEPTPPRHMPTGARAQRVVFNPHNKQIQDLGAALTKVLPHDSLSRYGHVFHAQGMRIIVDRAIRDTMQRYKLTYFPVPIGHIIFTP